MYSGEYNVFDVFDLITSKTLYSPEYIKTHTKNIMIIEHIGIEGTRLSSEIPHTRTDLASYSSVDRALD